MILSGFAFSGYRSFGSEEKAVIAPLQKINFLIGANNSGKSNVMRLICEHQTLFTKHETKFDQLDIPQVGSGNFKFSIAASKETIKELSKSLITRTDYKGEEVHLEWLFGTELFEHIGQGEDVYTWLNVDNHSSHTHEPLDKQYALTLTVPCGFSWRNINISLNNSYYQTDKENIPDVLNAMARATPKLNFSPIFIPAIRQIGTSDSQLSNQSDFSGSGIIDRLQKLERPAIGVNQEDKKSSLRLINFCVLC
ncbi:hypothetical protein RJD39_22180 (plasmid) [Vibrio scophthalmi]|uniref:hypothetical protein n=1 Tax=Vibrio scophthalmi TaxID=45658 RepID=UPI00350E452B